jgi:hypothetical protein
MEYGNRYSLVCTATGWKAGVRLSAGAKIFVHSIAFRPFLGQTHPPLKRVPGALSPGGSECEANHSSPSTTGAKTGRDTPPLPHTSSCHGA